MPKNAHPLKNHFSSINEKTIKLVNWLVATRHT